MIKTVIFDMDGVIVDTEPLHYDAYMQHFKELNIDVSPELYATFTGNSTKNVYQKIKNYFPDITVSADTLVNRKRVLFNEGFDTKKDLYLLDGVEALIKDLHGHGMQLILASSSAKATIDKIFNRFHLFPYFTNLVSGEDFPKSKPDPAIFLHAASLSRAPKEHCIVIEDSTHGVQAAVDAGIFCVGYTSKNSKLQDLSLANKVITHFNELDFDAVSQLKSQQQGLPI